MAKKKKQKQSLDVNILAKSIVARATHEELLPEPTKENLPAIKDVQNLDVTVKEKNPAAVALGRLGGLKGGKARAEKLSAKKRREIAQKAANARWSRSQ